MSFHKDVKTTFTLGQARERQNAQQQQQQQQQEEAEVAESSVKHKESDVWFKQAEKMATGSPSSSSGASPPGDSNIANDMARGTPTDGSPEAHLYKSPNQQELERRKSQYYKESFAIRETYHSPRNRVTQESVVVVKIITNAVLEDVTRAISDLSCHLALTFQRPEDSIMVIIQHDVTMIFGVDTRSAYFLTVTALSGIVGSVTNLRNTILIQGAVRETLNIPENRGVVKFDPVSEDNMGINNLTIHEEINRLENKMSVNGDGVMKTLSRSMSRKKRPGATRVNTAPAGPGLTPSNSLSSVGRGRGRFNQADGHVQQTVSLPVDRLHSTLSAVCESASESPHSPKKKQEMNRFMKTYNHIKKKIMR